ncbi:MAG: PaaI family thioesterase, partial [Deltaproteobacteria bacterium]|nr:PaaI family thioesterase [Deltaproteobacteria bacterium]
MRHLVKGKQPNSKMCLVCGMKNSFGLRSFFYELDNDELLAVFKPIEEHQSYPGRLHGGIATAILDETVGRAIMMRYSQEVWGVTLEFSTRYRQPIPLDEDIRVVGRVTKEARRHFEGTGEILLKDGRVAVEGWGKYLKLPLDKIADFNFNEQEWMVVPDDSDPE